MENNLPLQNNTAPRPKRLLLYAHYDRDGQVDPHVVYQIKALHDFGISIIFISNSPVSEEDKGVLSPFITNMRLRPDEGYDWTAWKEALLALGIEGLSKYDELILMNDSCYGPVFPLEEMFSKMDKEDVDFWGITENTDPHYIYHIQPYLCVFKNKIFISNKFMEFWKGVHNIVTYSDAVTKGELCMTKYFVDNGYQYSVYVNMEHMVLTPEIGVEQPLAYTVAPWLVRTSRVPFIKIKAFMTARGKQFNMGQELFTALEDCDSNYPACLILNHLRRTRPLSWQKNLPGTLVVIDENTPGYPNPGLKIAVFAHLFYLDQVEEAVGWLSNIPYPFDLYVSTSSADKATAIRSIAESHTELRAQKIEIRVMEDRGRDVAPWLLGFKDVQAQYDLALKFHMKKKAEPNPVFLWEWNNFLMQNTLGSPEYVSSIIYEFFNNDNLGVLFHMFPHAPALFFSDLESYEDKMMRYDIFKRLFISPPEETSQVIFPNNIFWYRPKSLERLFQSDITIEDFPPEPFPGDGTIAHGLERAIPYIAQAAGYYYKLSVSCKYTVSVLQHYEDTIFFKNYSIRDDKIDSNVYFECYRVPPERLPIGRAFQIVLFSLFSPLLKYKKINNSKYIKKKKNKLIKYCHKEPELIPCGLSIYIAFRSIFDHV